jgi:hypothetical protein
MNQNDRNIKLIKEFYPYALAEAEQAIELGPLSGDHVCDPECEDCEWYNWGISFMLRVQKGEFNEFNS